MSGTESPWQVYRRLMGFARPYRMLLVLAGLGMLIEAAAGGAFSKLMEPVVNETFIDRDRAKSLLLPLAIVGLFVIRGIAGYVTDMGMGKAARSIARDVRVNVLGKYLRLPGLRFDTEPGRPYLKSARRQYDTDHYLQVLRTGAVRLADSPEQLIDEVRRYLADPALERAERADLVRTLCYRADGQAGARVAEAIARIGARHAKAVRPALHARS